MDEVIHLDADLRPTGVSTPCPAKAEGPFFATDATYLGCGLLMGHDGRHRFEVTWEDSR